MGDTDKSTKIVVAGGILAFLSVIFFLVWAWKRKQSWGIIFTYYGVIIFVLLILVLIASVVIWALIKRKKNMIAINRNAILSACNEGRPTHNQKLAFAGDSDKHIESRFIGNVLGICQILSEPIYEEVKGKDNKRTKELKYPEQSLTFVAYRKFGGLLGSIFESPRLVCLLSELKDNKGEITQTSDHTSLNGSTIYLNGGSFMPRRYGMFFLSKHYKKTWIIDESIKKSIDRYLLEELLIQSQEIVDDGLAIDKEHKKEREKSMAEELGIKKPEGGQ